MARASQVGLDCTADARIHFPGKLWNEEGQDIAEYAVMLAVILVLAIGTIRLIGSNAGTVFSMVSSALG